MEVCDHLYCLVSTVVRTYCGRQDGRLSPNLVPIPALPFSKCVTLDKLFSFDEP